ncbi:MarR family winged helix-turn-helix transcriptional regulator [Azospirillum brasilense]|uniref:Winged helix-turn-helix transcriptional regulator n=1 Tax=Azospirillum brasilense TaxID=192 RepID=A0A6L3B0L1_AZOBR|nr:MarR family transcriptional regulator [Azospirillum brasilense]KAA0685198.1 winged helix-turn-helix transcriptional regulator [Azospirillum brasilense]
MPAHICPDEVRPDEVTTVVHVLEAFRKLDPDLPIQYALSFMTIAQNEGISIGELAERLGIAQSSASRNVAALSRWHSFGKAGLDLVQAQEDPRERRRKIVTLTDTGRAFLEQLRAIVTPTVHTPSEPRRARSA